MNIKQAAAYLFVSHRHVRELLDQGALAGTPAADGDYEINDASVEQYAARRKHAAKDYFDSQSEDSDPVGL
jgi:excisionase family DNA binding protein